MARKQHLIASIAGVIVAAIAATVATCWHGNEPQPEAPQPEAATVARMDSVEAAHAAAEIRAAQERDARRAARKKSPRLPHRRNHLDEPVPGTPR